MRSIHKIAANTLIVVAFLGLGGCADMTKQQKSTAGGAAVGAVAGGLISGTGGAVAGAVVGGVVGHEISKDSKK